MGFDPSQVLNLVGQLGGDHQQAAQQLQGMDQVDPQQHAGLLNQIGVDPQQLQNGGYQQHLDAQQQPVFNGLSAGPGLRPAAAQLRRRRVPPGRL